MQREIQAFIDNLQAERGLSPHTLLAYQSDLSQFAVWLGERARFLLPSIKAAWLRLHSPAKRPR